MASARPSSTAIVIVLLVLAVAAAFFPAGSAGFVNLDDDAYVEFAPMVNRGFTRSGVVWALTSIHTANWHPLTTFSHMLDCQLFGLKPAPMHWENILWHAANAVLVFLVWQRSTRTVWRAGIIAGLFALHPLHVESVAWISSRKDLLSTFFWLLGILVYVGWTRRKSGVRYLGVVVCLVLALLAKPMAVTFPCTLVLLDLWPLGRWPAQKLWPLLREKGILFVVVLLHAGGTFLVQHAAGAADYAARFDLGMRIGNAFVAYVRYLGKTMWPESLAPLYHMSRGWPVLTVLGAIVLLALISAAVWWQRRQCPWLAFGWLWFLGTLVPVIGLIQVGAQSMADRYTYVPLLGVFTAIAWFGAELVARAPQLRRPLQTAAIVALSAFAVLTAHQSRAWSNSISLYRHSLAVGEDNPGIRYLLANALSAAGRPEAEVVAEFQRALKLEPGYINARTQLAGIALRQERMDEAVRLSEENVKYEPQNAGVYFNLAVLASRQKRTANALRFYQEAIRLKPDYGTAFLELGRLHARENKLPEALKYYARAAELMPWDLPTLTEYGILAANLGDLATGRRVLARAVWIDPNHGPAKQNLSVLEGLIRNRRS
ncbi:MAG: tetratricopeptide repeat protein [Opitutaceae bacterium]|nr:tetratricopeptide repeat protein [Opitutaceae bacterium]